MGKFCTSCGEPILADFKFCGECGSRVESSPVASSSNINTQVRQLLSAPSIKRADTEPSFSTTKRLSSGSAPIPIAPRNDITAPQVARSLENKPISSQMSVPESSGRSGGGGGAREEAYIKSGGTANEIRKIEVKREKELRLQSSLDPVTCYCCFRTVSHKMLNKPTGKPDCMLYIVECVLAQSTWTISRRFKQFKVLDTALRIEIPGFDGDLPPKIPSKFKFETRLNEERVAALDAYTAKLEIWRSSIFRSQKAASAFVRFILPTQANDSKPPDFIMPLKVELY